MNSSPSTSPPCTECGSSSIVVVKGRRMCAEHARANLWTSAVLTPYEAWNEHQDRVLDVALDVAEHGH